MILAEPAVTTENYFRRGIPTKPGLATHLFNASLLNSSLDLISVDVNNKASTRTDSLGHAGFMALVTAKIASKRKGILIMKKK